jgi:hypothetical protein
VLDTYSKAMTSNPKRPANYVGHPIENKEDKREQLEARANDRREKACEILDAIKHRVGLRGVALDVNPASQKLIDDCLERRDKYGVRFLVSENTLQWLEDIAEEFNLL